jgi:hypothetical protein
MSQTTYDPRITKMLEEIATTPTGWPLVDYVRLHWPRITYGTPAFGGGAFAYPWPFSRILLMDVSTEEWQRETLAHELVHLVRWRGHLVGSLEQEYDAYLTAAKVRCEFRGWDWTQPDEQAIKHYPLFFGPKANKAEYKRQLPSRLAFYSALPWEQPYAPLPIFKAMLEQTFFGSRVLVGNLKKRIAKDPDAPKKQP